MAELHLEVLDKKRQAILPALDFLRQKNRFYLAGGTALALQIGHRTSLDFDFYSPKDFDPERLYAGFRKVLPGVQAIRTADGTLISLWKRIELSFFRYAYDMLKPLVRMDHLDLASMEDIAAMKLIAIVQRGKKRDFIDMYYLLKHFDLGDIFNFAKRKYPTFNPYMGLRSLTYFEDAQRDTSRPSADVFERISWEKIKKDIVFAVDKYSKENLLGA